MLLLTLLPALLTLITLPFQTTAHMQLHHPAPFNSTSNPHRLTPPDPYLTHPYHPHLNPYPLPCRGYLSLLHTPEGAPTAHWPQTSTQKFSLSGSGNHYGGSCQIGFIDFHTQRTQSDEPIVRVVRSYQGNCPHRHGGMGPTGQEFEFTVPSDLEPGLAVFVWAWWNREGEGNWNCAPVEITAPSAASRARLSRFSSAGAAAGDMLFAERPEMLRADVGDGCETPRGTAEVRFPLPGGDVLGGDGEYPLELPIGTCRGL